MLIEFLENKKWIIAIIVLIFVLIVTYLSLGKVVITTIPEKAVITLDNKKFVSPLNKVVLVGKYNIVIEGEDHEKKKEEIMVSSGTNEFSFVLRTNKEVLISDMPKTTDLWSADHIKDGDFFTVSLLSENQVEAKNDFLNFVKNTDVDPKTITINYDAPAIFDNKVGP